MSFINELRRRNVVRVGIAYALIAWVILQAADFGLQVIDAPNWILQVFVLAAAIGLPMVLIFSWIFEMTPEGIKRETEIDRSASVAPETGRKLDRTIIIFLVLVIAVMGLERFWPGAEKGPEPLSASAEKSADPLHDSAQATSAKSIAVLPFVNMSSDADNEYFSDGISEELLNVLVRVSALEVASRTSSFAYKGKDLSTSQIAAELNVNHILEGSVRKAGNRVRITAQLIDATSDRHIWSETYERELDDIFGIQEEISNNIVEALQLALNSDEAAAMARLQRPTNNSEAYELYLQGRYQWRQREEQNLRRSIESFEQAIALDPTFAKAHEALAAAWIVLPSWSSVSLNEATGNALESANRALELDDNLGEAYAIRAHAMQIDKDWLGAYQAFQKALEREPRNATVRQWYAEFLGDAGYTNRALTMGKQAYELDPAAPVINLVLTSLAAQAGDTDVAQRHYERAIELGVVPSRMAFVFSPVLLAQGDLETLREIMLVDSSLSPLVRECLAAAIDSETPSERIRALLDEDSGTWQHGRSWCATLSDDKDLALDTLRETVLYDSIQLRYAWQYGGRLKGFLEDERFKALLVDAGLIPLYRSEGWPDQCQPVGDDDFNCE